MNIAKILAEVDKLMAAGFTREQAAVQISTMDDVIEDRIMPIINDFNHKLERVQNDFSEKLERVQNDFSEKIEKLEMKMTIRLGSIMGAGLILSTGIIGIMIFLKN